MTQNAFIVEIATAIDRSSRTQTEIARELGYRNPNIITMFKKGDTRVPFGKVAGLSRLVGLDPCWMLRRWLAVYEANALPDLDMYFRPL